MPLLEFLGVLTTGGQFVLAGVVVQMLWTHERDIKQLKRDRDDDRKGVSLLAADVKAIAVKEGIRL